LKKSGNRATRRHVIVAGAGAAGLTAAIFAAGAGARVTLLERTDKAGKKILMSGGTRCNVLPVHMEMSDYFTGSSPNLMKRVFRSWDLEACRRWFTGELGLELACEEASNKWFPRSNSAVEVRDRLLEKALALGVDIVYNAPVVRIGRDLNVVTLQGKRASGAEKTWTADAVIVATGGLSIPSIGTDGMGHKFLRNRGHLTGPVYPALTPLTTQRRDHMELAGVSLDVSLSVWKGGKKVAGAARSGFLFTHRGYSGPAVLDVAHHYIQAAERAESAAEPVVTEGAAGTKGTEVNKGHDVTKPMPEFRVDWDGSGPEIWEKRLLEGKGKVLSVLRNHLPNRLAEMICSEARFADRNAAELSRTDRRGLVRLLSEYKLEISGHEGYKKAEVTGGGVPLSEVNTATLESSIQPGLYLCGEILDVFGRIGGFNFYWAWVTGRLAGMSAARFSG
jgi:predicted flavoprotein YhiN